MSKKRVKYPACKIKFGIVIHACSTVISKVNVELFKCSVGIGHRKRENTHRHHGSQCVIEVFPSKKLEHRKTIRPIKAAQWLPTYNSLFFVYKSDKQWVWGRNGEDKMDREENFSSLCVHALSFLYVECTLSQCQC